MTCQNRNINFVDGPQIVGRMFGGVRGFAYAEMNDKTIKNINHKKQLFI